MKPGPEVSTGGVGVSELLEVVCHSFLEVVGTNVGLDHSQNTGPFAVADLVKQLLDFCGVADFGLDRMGALQAVSSLGSGGLCPDKVLPDGPLWIGGVDGFLAHECREAFIEPYVIPPFHRDEIAEPHVGNLMGNDACNRFLGLDGRVLVNVQAYLSIGYSAPVFHCAVREFRDSDLVEFG